MVTMKEAERTVEVNTDLHPRTGLVHEDPEKKEVIFLYSGIKIGFRTDRIGIATAETRVKPVII